MKLEYNRAKYGQDTNPDDDKREAEQRRKERRDAADEAAAKAQSARQQVGRMISTAGQATSAAGAGTIGGATSAIGSIVAAAGPAAAVAVVAGAAVFAIHKMGANAGEFARKAADLAPQTAMASAQADITRQMGELRRARQMDAQAAQYAKRASDVEQKREDVLAELAKAWMPIQEAFWKVEVELLGDIKTVVEFVAKKIQIDLAKKENWDDFHTQIMRSRPAASPLPGLGDRNRPMNMRVFQDF